MRTSTPSEPPPSKPISCDDALAAARTRVGSAAFELHAAGVDHGGRSALAGADLVVEPGAALALVGPSGAGKTTLLRLLNASIRPSRGSVCVNYRDLAQLSPAELREVRSRIGFVHQDLALVPNLRVSQNVIAGRLGAMGFLRSARAMLFPGRADLARASEILERVGIGEKLFQRTDSLSGGERQRVAIARALFQEPWAILADEPVSSVDPARARDTVELLREVCAERGLTLIVSLHDLELARSVFPRLVGLRAGRIVFDRPPAEIGAAEFGELYRLEGGATAGPGGDGPDDPRSDATAGPEGGGPDDPRGGATAGHGR